MKPVLLEICAAESSQQNIHNSFNKFCKIKDAVSQQTRLSGDYPLLAAGR